MNSVMGLMLLALFMGNVMGSLSVVGWRFLRRVGTTEIISVDPHSTTFDRSYVRKSGSLWEHKHGAREGTLPVSESTVFSKAEGVIQPSNGTHQVAAHRVYTKNGGSARLLLVDGAAMVPIGIDPAVSRAVHPSGERLNQVARSIAYKTINEEERGFEWGKLMPIALVALLVIGVLAIVILSKVVGIAGGMGSGGGGP